MIEHIPNFSPARVLVVGDIMLDRYWHGATSRISPEAPVPVVNVQQLEHRPGGAANVALNVAALGAQVTLIGVVGKDAEAEELTQILQNANVSTRFVTSNHQPTITKLRVLSQRQQLIRLDFEQTFSEIDSTPLIELTREAIKQADILVLSDYGKGSLTDPQALIALARQYNIPVLVDPKGKEFTRYAGATLLTPNRREFETVMGQCADESELVQKAQHAISMYKLSAMLITRGAEGMTLVDQHPSLELHIPTHAREVYDVTGAGDTVIAVLATALAAQITLEQATHLANLAAGLAVARLGTVAISAPELRYAVEQKWHTDHQASVLNEQQLQLIVENARARGERIVVTNGCFDILHAGHVTYLQQAKRLGQRLIVLVNDDASVRRLKGTERPINTLKRRMAVLTALSAVDWVVPFSEDTPERLIQLIKPDVLTKGGDYQASQIAGSDWVIKHGGSVEILPLVEGCSTTTIVEQIKETESIL
ncbi:MAG: bifunctional D-glycero-beta-D-manno-heptose-7-phosphate kinase/D-glycero-beta-D-manno-heptose 1-phosphate adenylyltransferase HldE [Gammaproteobacteria bacterium]